MNTHRNRLIGLTLFVGILIGVASSSLLSSKPAQAQLRVPALAGDHGRAVQAINKYVVDTGLSYQYLVLFEDGTIQRVSVHKGLNDK